MYNKTRLETIISLFQKLRFFTIFIMLNILLGLPWLLFYLFRQTAIVSSKCFVPGIGKIFSEKDVFFIGNYNSRHGGTIVIMATVQGDISVEAVQERGVRALLQAKNNKGGSKLKFPELMQIQTSFLGYSFWKDDPEFKLENHIHHITLDGDSSTSDPSYFQDWEAMASEFSGRPYPPNRSPWEVYFVRQTGSSGIVAIGRAHHLLMDGFSMTSMLKTFLGEAPPPVPVGSSKPPPQPVNTLKNSLGLSMMMSMMWRLPEGFRKFTSQMKQNRRVQRILLDARNKLEEELPVRDHTHQKYSVTLPTHQLKALAAHFRVRVSSVLTTLLAESISNACPTTETGGGGGEMAVLYVCPLPNHPGTLTNHVFFSTLEVPLSTDQPIFEKLRSINESYLGLTSNPINGFLLYGAFLLGKVHPLIHRLVRRSLLYSPLLISNFTLGHGGIQWGGMEVSELRAASGVSPGLSGSGAIILGYKDHVRVLFGGHDSLFTEAQVEAIASGIGENFDKLVRLSPLNN